MIVQDVTGVDRQLISGPTSRFYTDIDVRVQVRTNEMIEVERMFFEYFWRGLPNFTTLRSSQEL